MSSGSGSLARLQEDIVRSATTASKDTLTPGRAAAMDATMWETVLDVLAATKPEQPKARARRSLRVIRRVSDYVAGNEDHPIAVADLCAVAGCSIKTLETLFVECFDETPNRYLRRRRMWRARDRLRAADPAERTVSQIAVDCGFWELGRFAVAYRALFGESPSQTLRRPASGSAANFRNLHRQRRKGAAQTSAARDGVDLLAQPDCNDELPKMYFGKPPGDAIEAASLAKERRADGP